MLPNILACFKWVVDEAYIRSSGSGELDLEWAEYKLSDYDRNAIEEAVRIQEAYGGSVAAVTVGLPEATKAVKDALSRGPEKAYFISDDSFAGLEPSQTAAILAQGIKERIPFDLIICGEGSSDLYAQQVGPRLAYRLGIPCLTYVQKLSVDGNKIIAEQKIENGVQVVTAEMPALVTVAPDINTPRIPGLKDTLAASKKPVEYIDKDELEGEFPALLKTGVITAARMERNCVKFGAGREDIAAFIDALKKAGVLNRG